MTENDLKVILSAFGYDTSDLSTVTSTDYIAAGIIKFKIYNDTCGYRVDLEMSSYQKGEFIKECIDLADFICEYPSMFESYILKNYRIKDIVKDNDFKKIIDLCRFYNDDTSVYRYKESYKEFHRFKITDYTINDFKLAIDMQVPLRIFIDINRNSFLHMVYIDIYDGEYKMKTPFFDVSETGSKNNQAFELLKNT